MAPALIGPSADTGTRQRSVGHRSMNTEIWKTHTSCFFFLLGSREEANQHSQAKLVNDDKDTKNEKNRASERRALHAF